MPQKLIRTPEIVHAFIGCVINGNFGAFYSQYIFDPNRSFKEEHLNSENLNSTDDMRALLTQYGYVLSETGTTKEKNLPGTVSQERIDVYRKKTENVPDNIQTKSSKADLPTQESAALYKDVIVTGNDQVVVHNNHQQFFSFHSFLFGACAAVGAFCLWSAWYGKRRS